MRKHRVEPVSRGKQLAIKGDQLITPINRATPLACLLDDSKIFGPDYHDKTPPSLPHEEGCQCELTPNYRRSDDIFHRSAADEKQHQSDLGLLTSKELRFYKYQLIAHHAQAEGKRKQEYLTLAQGIAISEDFKNQTINHLELKKEET